MVKITNKDSRCVMGLPMFVIGNKRLSHQEGVRRLREEHSMSRGEFAKAIGVSERTVDGWAIGRPINAASLIAIHNVFGDDE